MARLFPMILMLKVPDWVFWALRLTISAVFIYTGVIKAIAPLRFATDIDNFHLLPWVLTVRLAFYLPWLEILCGAALLMGQLDRGAVLVLLILMSLFVVALASARARGIDISCGCFGHAARNLAFSSHFALDLGIIAALLLLFRVGTRSMVSRAGFDSGIRNQR